MPNYQNGKIYTIRCRSDEALIYVGSTTQSLSQRMAKHRFDYNNEKCCSLYNYIIDDNWDDWYIELYEHFPCNTREELVKREGQVIREIGTINIRIEGRTRKEYYEQNTDKIKEKVKEYREQNADKIKEYMKEYYEQNADKIKEKGKEYYEQNADKIKEQNKERNKKYYEQNTDKFKEKGKEYREQNADKIKERNKKYYEQNADKFKERNKKYRERKKEEKKNLI